MKCEQKRIVSVVLVLALLSGVTAWASDWASLRANVPAGNWEVTVTDTTELGSSVVDVYLALPGYDIIIIPAFDLAAISGGGPVPVMMAPQSGMATLVLRQGGVTLAVCSATSDGAVTTSDFPEADAEALAEAEAEVTAAQALAAEAEEALAEAEEALAEAEVEVTVLQEDKASLEAQLEECESGDGGGVTLAEANAALATGVQVSWESILTYAAVPGTLQYNDDGEVEYTTPDGCPVDMELYDGLGSDAEYLWKGEGPGSSAENPLRKTMGERFFISLNVPDKNGEHVGGLLMVMEIRKTNEWEMEDEATMVRFEVTSGNWNGFPLTITDVGIGRYDFTVFDEERNQAWRQSVYVSTE
jgi:hypothetical protein